VRRALATATAALLAVLVFPAAGAAADCGAKQGQRIDYEDAAVQVFARAPGKRSGDRAIVACSRLTGRKSKVAVESGNSDESISVEVRGVVAGRYLWTVESFSYAESFDVEQHQLFDLRTRRKVRATSEDEDTLADVTAVPGALVVADGKTLVQRDIGGGERTLASGTALRAPAVGGDRLYWQAGPSAFSAPLAVEPDAVAEHPALRTRRRAACLPRRRTVLLRAGGLVVSEAGDGTVTACRLRTRRQVDLVAVLGDGVKPTGPPGRFIALDGRRLLYQVEVETQQGLTGMLVVLDLKTGRVRRSVTVPGLTGTASAGDVVAFTDGGILSLLERGGRRDLAQGAIGHIALTTSDLGDGHRALYWSDGETPRWADLDAAAPAGSA
jgi:hypothetical protein